MKRLAVTCVFAVIGIGTWLVLRPAARDACELPPRDCEGGDAYCSELVQFLPSATDSYEDRAVDGEESTATSTSYLRRDLMMLVQYATAKVACASADRAGNHAPLALGDMSDRDGNIPGTAHGLPRHPTHTHEDGYDIDLAYYQRNTADNHLRAICQHGIGVDAYHCTRPPRTLDARRTALLIGTLFESPRARIVGVDGAAGPAIQNQLERLCARGEIPRSACQRVKLAYEIKDGGHGWYYGHHNHLHLSLRVDQ